MSVDAGSRGPQEGEEDSDRELLWRELRLLTVLGAVAAGVAVFVLATGVFLLVFAGVLAAIVLRAAADALSAYLPLPPRVSLAIVLVVLVAGLVAATFFAAPRVVDQATQFAERLPEALDAVDDWISNGLDGVPGLSVRDMLPAAQSMLGTLPNIVTTTFGAVGGLVVVAAVGVYLAAHPAVYRDGFVRLFALKRREYVRSTLNEVGDVLRRWLVGQFATMVLVGLLSYAALRLLDVPLALGLALLTGVLEFVPYIGPIAAAVPVVLVASTESWQLAAYALLAYVAIQMIEGYVASPLIQERAIFMPPGALIFAQVLLGVLFGIVGIVLATPITAAVSVFVRRCYVEAVLEKPHDHDGEGTGGAS